MVPEASALKPWYLKWRPYLRLRDSTQRAATLGPLSTKILAIILAGLATPTDAAPLEDIQCPRVNESSSLDQTGGSASNSTNSGASSIVPNFQDLSAVLSLLAADVVEEKFCSPSAPLWERMSAAWSIFGIMGLGRACIKIAAGLDVAEAAGFRLNGAGAFTSKRTKAAFSAWPAGSSRPGPWCDDSGQLLGSAYVPPGTWKKPFIIMHGYSQCPLERTGRQFYWEMSDLFLVAFLTVVLELGPLLLLWKYTPSDLGSLTLALGIVSSLFGGCGLPMVLTMLNVMDIPHLADLAPLGLHSKVRGGLFQPGDLIMATSDQRIVKWQTRSSWTRSGDSMLVRCFAVISLLAVLASYILNYALLGAAKAHVTYAWLGFQIEIMAGRYFAWARKPSMLHVRNCTLVYTVMGSLHDHLPAGPSQNGMLHLEKGSTLTENLIEVAVAAACSKLTNHDISTAMYDLAALRQLAGTAPRDILLAQRCHLQDIPEEDRGSYHVVRLPWPFIEELYLAQGLLLGPNPRSYEGLDAAAVFDRNRFMGLTSVHPELFYGNRMSNIVGRTVDGVAVCEDLTKGGLTWKGWFKLNQSMDLEHHRFWQNVDSCRNTAVANGPASVEIHAVYDGGRASWNRVHQRVHGVESALELVRRICITAARKDHDSCGTHCTLYRLEN